MSRYKPYPKYKESGVEWLGIIPTNWQVQRLKYLCNITTGNKDTENKIDSGQYPFYVRSQTIERIDSYSFEGEAILTAGDGVGVGKVFHYVNGKFDFHQRVYMFYNFKNILGTFLFEYIKNNLYKIALEGGAKSTVDSLRLPLLQNFAVTLPAHEEQVAIANFLDHETAKIDTLIDKQQRLIELLKEKRQAVISHAVTKGLDPNVKMKDSGVEWLGEVPEHWIKSKLGFETIVKARLGWKGLKADEYIKDGYIFLATPNIKNNEIDFTNVNYITEKRYKESPEIMLEEGDVLVTKDGSTTGTTNVVRMLPKPATVNSSIAVIRPQKNLGSIYLYYFFVSSYIQETINMMRGGMGVPHLFQADLRWFNILLPPKDEQQQIADYLDTQTTKIDTLIEKANQSITLLKERRTALISAAVTGKIDVRGVIEKSSTSSNGNQEAK